VRCYLHLLDVAREAYHFPPVEEGLRYSIKVFAVAMKRYSINRKEGQDSVSECKILFRSSTSRGRERTPRNETPILSSVDHEHRILAFTIFKPWMILLSLLLQGPSVAFDLASSRIPRTESEELLMRGAGDRLSDRIFLRWAPTQKIEHVYLLDFFTARNSRIRFFYISRP
jgi:hypothetical protein